MTMLKRAKSQQHKEIVRKFLYYTLIEVRTVKWTVDRLRDQYNCSERSIHSWRKEFEKKIYDDQTYLSYEKA